MVLKMDYLLSVIKNLKSRKLSIAQMIVELKNEYNISISEEALKRRLKTVS